MARPGAEARRGRAGPADGTGASRWHAGFQRPNPLVKRPQETLSPGKPANLPLGIFISLRSERRLNVQAAVRENPAGKREAPDGSVSVQKNRCPVPRRWGAASRCASPQWDRFLSGPSSPELTAGRELLRAGPRVETALSGLTALGNVKTEPCVATDLGTLNEASSWGSWFLHYSKYLTALDTVS